MENKAIFTHAWQQLPKRILSVFVILAVMDGLLFGAAGRVDWIEPWVLTLLYGAFLLGFAFWATMYAPGLLEERSHVAKNVKSWDKTIGVIYTILLLAMLITAGLDAGRFHWSTMPIGLEIIGAIGLVPVGAWLMWIMSVNAFLSRWARIQDDRGHQVITAGPYQYIRHPMYASTILFVISIPLLLGSWWALIPGISISVLYVIRTALEDRMLHEELSGYREYAARVRYRLVPGVW